MNIYRDIANSLTILRILLIAPLIIFFQLNNLTVVFVIFLVGAITDLLDGYFARKSNTKSIWGAKYDPFADKIFILIPLLWLVSKDIVPFWSLSLIILRDLLVTSERNTDKNGRPAIKIAKAKTITTFISIILLIFPGGYISINLLNTITEIGLYFYWIAFSLTLLTGIKYLFK